MKTFKLLLAGSLSLLFSNSFAQTLINKVWEQQTGHPTVAFDHMASARAGSEVIIVGNTYHLGEQENFLITKYNTSGTLLWQKEYNSLTGDRDFGMDVYIKGSYVYVTGFSWDSVANDADMVTLKLTLDSGNLVWSAIYAGSWGGYDAAAGLVVDNSGNVYVAGTEQKGTLDFKMTILKYNSSGTQQWVAHYDSAGYYDGAVAIYLNSTGTRLSATGFSGSAFTNWDFVTLPINMSTGAIGTIARNANPNGGISKPVALTQDFDGNWYVLGATALSPTNSDIKLIKYDTLFNEVWVRTFGSADSLADEPAAITVNPHHRLCITGFTSRSNGATDMLTLAYDKNGNLLWNRSISSTNPSKDAKGRDIKAEATFDGHLYVTGKLDKGSDHDYVTASYTQDGDLRWLKMFDDTTGSDDKAIDIALDAANNPIVSGICVKDTNTKYVSVKYEQWEVNTTFVTDTLGFPIYAANQLLIKFSPSVVNADFVDNKDVMFASLTNVIADSVIDAINLKLNYDISRSIAVKVFKRMTTRDSISISRLGDTVRMEPTWSEFLITGLTELNLQNAADSLDSLGYSLVEFAEPNYVYYFHSVDTYIDSQASLTPNVTFNDANINIEPAWSIETGKSYIKVGVIDGSIDFTHEDFGDGTYFGSKIAGGWNFYHNLHASQVTKPSVHGTACAGIIGALRRNGKGIAGIAGGDMDNANAGVQLFSLGIAKSGFYRDTFSTLNVIADAIQEGAAYNPNTGYGYGLHIQSNSWGWGANSNSLYNAIVSCSQNRCVFVASRGNFYNGSNPSGTTVTSMNYPACYDDDLVINVGASGNNGMHKTNSNGDATYESMYDNGVDLIAPGSLDIVLTTCATGFPGYSHAASGIPLFSDTTYTRFSGTSSACPHVAGAAGLLLSRHHVNQGYPNNLDPDDIQHLLKTYTTPAGSDSTIVGDGLLNAGAAMQMIDLPHYWVQHDDGAPSQTMTSSPNITVYLQYNCNGLKGDMIYSNCTMYTITNTYTDTFSSSAEIIDYWSRNKWSSGFVQSYVAPTGTHIINPIYRWADYNFSVNGNSATITATTYCWLINGIWIPAPPSQITTAYSLHVHDPEATGIKDELTAQDFLTVYPNPTGDVLWASYILQSPVNVQFSIKDITGKSVLLKTVGNVTSGSQLERFDVRQFAAGVYFLEMRDDKQTITRKVLINR